TYPPNYQASSSNEIPKSSNIVAPEIKFSKIDRIHSIVNRQLPIVNRKYLPFPEKLTAEALLPLQGPRPPVKTEPRPTVNANFCRKIRGRNHYRCDTAGRTHFFLDLMGA
ncbi:MAG: hypothetical protein WCD88_15260, partial [Desulfobacterales bacterium]